MIVVADTSPFNYLIQLGYVELLQVVYGRVFVPRAVLRELTHAGAPLAVRAWALAPPTWLEEVVVQSLDQSLSSDLGAGEREAISFALYVHADVLLVDERLGRREAEDRQIVVAGTLAVLLKSSVLGYIDLPQALAGLKKLGFRSTAKLEESLLAEYRAAKESPR